MSNLKHLTEEQLNVKKAYILKQRGYLTGRINNYNMQLTWIHKYLDEKTNLNKE